MAIDIALKRKHELVVLALIGPTEESSEEFIPAF